MLFRKAGSSPHKKLQLRCWRRPLMVRQPYSEAVQSDVSVPYKGNRRGRKDYWEERFPLFPWGEKTEMRGGPSLKGKGGLVGFRKKNSLILRKSGRFSKKIIINTKEIRWFFESPFTINCEMMQSKSIISHHLAPFLMTCFIWHHCQIKSSYLCIVIQREWT